MQIQTQNLINYLEDENVPSVNLSIFRKKNERIVKDLKTIQKKSDSIYKIQKKSKKNNKLKDKKVMDGNIERKTRPLTLKSIIKKEKKITWL
jgi:hypothetical protein